VLACVISERFFYRFRFVFFESCEKETFDGNIACIDLLFLASNEVEKKNGLSVYEISEPFFDHRSDVKTLLRGRKKVLLANCFIIFIFYQQLGI
jgi:hypothetical protein